MKLLHTGDLHLDSAFCSSNALDADERREGQRETLGRIIELARKEACDMVLISGDLFDGKYVTPETAKYVCQVFSEAGIPIIIAPGNHDPYVDCSFYKATTLPENVCVFSSNELQCFEFPELNVSVYGYAFTSSVMTSSPLAGQTPREDGSLRLLCSHADLSSPISRYCPVTRGDITALGIAYAALGHIHNRDTDDSEGESVIRYCGFPEGRSFDETGDGGVNIVELAPDMPARVRRASVSKHRYEIREISLDGCGEREDVIVRVKEAARKVSSGKDTHLRLILTGTVDGDIMPDTHVLEKEALESGALSVEIKDITLPVADISALRSDISIRGAFYNALYSGLIDNDPEVRERTALALQIGLSAIDGKRIVGAAVTGGKEEI